MQTNKGGFTLMEIVVVIGIAAVIAIVMNNFIVQGYRTWRFGKEQREAIDQARKGVEVMIRELRETKHGDDGSFSLSQAANQSITFFSDIDDDEITEKIRYFMDNTDLKKEVEKPLGTPPRYTGTNKIITKLSQYVRNGGEPIFYYYNRDYPEDLVNNPLPAPAPFNDIRLIKVLLEINVNPNIAPQDFVLESFVQLRNLKDNL